MVWLSLFAYRLFARYDDLAARAAIEHPNTANSPLSHGKNWRNSRRRRVMTQQFRYLFAALILLAAAVPGDAADLTLKRVVLSTGGRGYFEYQAAVAGDATLTLRVPPDQADDG